MFKGELEASLAILKGCVAAHPEDPLAASLSAAVPFYHFIGSRLQPNGQGSLQDMIVGKGIAPPANLDFIGTMLQWAERLAAIDLEAHPWDENALLALCVAEGVERDIRVLVYRRWMEGLDHARAASLQARRLLEVNAEAYDAYYVIGLSEYVLSRVPRLFRPFAKIPGIVGDRGRAVQFLEAASESGCYFRDFARQTLAQISAEQRRIS